MITRRTSARNLAKVVTSTLVLVSLAAVAPSYAQQPAKAAPSTSTRDNVAEARARFDEGVKLTEAGEHESARVKFNQAWALLENSAILFNLARSEELSDHPVEALEHFRRFAKAPPDSKISDAQRQRTTESIAELTKKVGQIEIEAPAGARITVDGRAIDADDPDPVIVTPGKHVVEAISNGKVRSVTVECAAGAIIKASLLELTGAAPLAPPPPTERESARFDATTAPRAEEEPSFWTGGRLVGLGVFAGGLIGLGAGVGFHMAAAHSEENVNALRGSLPEPRSSACSVPGNETTCAKLRGALDNQSQQQDIRTGLFIGGGALVLGGAVLFLVSSPDSKATRTGARVVPYASSRDAGLTVLGTF